MSWRKLDLVRPTTPTPHVAIADPKVDHTLLMPLSNEWHVAMSHLGMLMTYFVKEPSVSSA
jgi:hypothetical protein